MDRKYGKLIKIAMWSALILFAIRCAISWNDITSNCSAYELFGYAGEAIAVAVILTALYERKLWRYNPLETTPKLCAKYIGTFVSTHDNIERNGALDIKQTLTSINIIFSTTESRSRSLSTSIEKVMGENQLTYCYINQPKSEFRHRSEIHFGTAMLTITNDGKLKGQYFTDRQTRGDMEFVAVKK